MDTKKHEPLVQDLIELIKANGWEKIFEDGLKKGCSYGIPQMEAVTTLDKYFDWLDNELTWAPIDNPEGRVIYDHLCMFNFILDQEPIKQLQNPVKPRDKEAPLTPLSAWMVRFCNGLNKFMDTPESLTPATLETFKNSPLYNIDEYEYPRGGWKTFNQLFARVPKPGKRPIAAIADPSVIVSPADSTFAGQWEIRADSHVDIKGLDWKIEELLQGTGYEHAFEGGIFCHAFLNSYDYHRQHAPVSGKVLVAKTIPGTCYVDVIPGPDPNYPNTPTGFRMRRTFDAPDVGGYEFMQSRGCVIIDSPIGLVAALPIGMGEISSVVITCEVGQTLQKGDQIAYFQYGGSDMVYVFQQQSNVCITAQPGVHYKVGRAIGQAYPVIKRW